MKEVDKPKDLEFEIKFYENIIRSRPNFTQALFALGDAYTKNRQYEEGLQIDKKLSRLKPDDPIVFYNLACSYSLVEDTDASLDALKESIRLGYVDFDYMDKDSDLKNLRKDPRYQKLREKILDTRK